MLTAFGEIIIMVSGRGSCPFFLLCYAGCKNPILENLHMHRRSFKRIIAGMAALLLTFTAVFAGPSPVFTATAFAQQNATVQASALNVRSGPGTSYSRVDELVNGTQVVIENEVQGDDGKIWANVYLTDTIVVIDPHSGKVTATIDCKGLLPEKERRRDTDVLNGIAIDDKGRIYLTGKNWPKLYQIELLNK